MLVLETETQIERLTGREVFDFFSKPNDPAYQRWWPGVHLALHALSGGGGRVGDVVFMHEYIGQRRLRLQGIVVEAVPGKRLVWQLAAGIRLPVRLSLELTDTDDGLVIKHRVHAGWAGWGRVFDPIFRLYFSQTFITALDTHVRTEFRLLRDQLAQVHA